MKAGKTKHTRNGAKKTRPQKKVSGQQLSFRSRVTNGSHLLEHVDGRSQFARRFRDVIHIYTEDQGGEANLGEGKRLLIRRAACLVVELERMESKFAQNDGASNRQIEVYQRVANSLRRLVETIGLAREMRDITPPRPGTASAKEFVNAYRDGRLD